MATPLRVALIGYGLGGSAFHAPFIAATDGLELAAIVTSDPARAAAARSRYPRAPIRDRAERVWRSAGDYDVAVIATPNRTHVPLAMAALDAGLHVVVDKPLAATAAEARALIEHARVRERVLTVYQNRRWDGDFLTVRKLIAAGELGDVHRFESRFERWRPELKPGWRQDADPAAAGGVLYDLGAHLIDQALVLFGPVTDVYAEVNRVRAGAEVDDDTFIALTHASGVRSHLWMSLAAAAEGPRFRVLGRRGAFTRHGVDPQEARLRGGADPARDDLGSEPAAGWGILTDGNEERRVPTEAGDYGAFYTLLVRAIREGGPLPVDPLESVSGLEIIEQARGQLPRK
ncbi:MAG TPA: Gfo/Idh/MocA family oxidoreductase [Longimicrobiales bacterium]